MSTLMDAVKKEEDRRVYRDEYNKKPSVKAKRVLYNKKRNGEMSVAKRYTDSKINKEQAEKLIELLNTEYLTEVGKLEGKTNIARSPKHTDNH